MVYRTANNLTLIPKSFLDLTNLRTLILNNNKIEKIENLSNLTLLEKLEMRGNKIEKIENLQNNKKLITLTLSSNLIKEINENTFPTLEKIKEFGIFGNYIGDDYDSSNNYSIFKKTIQIIANHLPEVKEIYIGGNFISQIPNFHNEIKTLLPSIQSIDGHNI